MTVESLASLEIKANNAQALAPAIHQTAHQLFGHLETHPEIFNHFQFNLTYFSQPLYIYDQQGNQILCVVRLALAKEDIHLAFRLSLVSETASYSQSLTFSQVANFYLSPNGELAKKSWSLKSDPQSRRELSVTSDMEVQDSYRNCGLGTCLLTEGETIKNELSRTIAVKLNKKYVRTLVSDVSSDSWTSRRIKGSLTGYNQVRKRTFVHSETVKPSAMKSLMARFIGKLKL